MVSTTGNRGENYARVLQGAAYIIRWSLSLSSFPATCYVVLFFDLGDRDVGSV